MSRVLTKWELGALEWSVECTDSTLRALGKLVDMGIRPRPKTPVEGIAKYKYFGYHKGTATGFRVQNGASNIGNLLTEEDFIRSVQNAAYYKIDSVMENVKTVTHIPHITQKPKVLEKPIPVQSDIKLLRGKKLLCEKQYSKGITNINLVKRVK